MDIANKKVDFPAKTIIAAFVSTIGLAACGGGGDGNPIQIPTSENTELRSTLVNQTARLTATAEGATNFLWAQTGGPDLTDLSGINSDTVEFTAPPNVETLRFTVQTSGSGESNVTEFNVVVTESGDAVFVDGSFTGESNGSIDAPYKQLSDAFEANDDNNQSDFYVKSYSAADDGYLISTIKLRSGQSLYGGYDGNWERDVVLNQTNVYGLEGVSIEHYNVTAPTIISGFYFDGVRLYGGGGDGLYTIANNTIELPDVAPANQIISGDRSIAISNIGIWSSVEQTSILNNIIDVGSASNGEDQEEISERISPLGNDGTGANGEDADEETAGDGGDFGSDICGCWNGGSGREGQRNQETNGYDGIDGNGDSLGGDGGRGGTYNDNTKVATDGEDGKTGKVGPDGSNGDGAKAMEIVFYPSLGLFETADAQSGGTGGSGGGGGGGGAGAAGSTGKNGGGGGGGGEGGDGGIGAPSANGGGFSIGIALFSGTRSIVTGNVIMTGNGGVGGRGNRGALGGTGGIGGDGGAGYQGATDISPGGDGGDGGNGGTGGNGGYGGSGAGGSSFGIYIHEQVAASISGNTVSMGDGGTGGASRVNSSTNAGDGGWSFGIFDADTEDSAVVANSDNDVTAGRPGASQSVAGTAGAINFQ